MKGGAHKLADNDFIDSIFEKVLTPIISFVGFIIRILFANRMIALMVYLLIVNAIAVVLMKRDKTYAENGERRIKESTLLIVALAGGSLGMYLSMFKFKHKTLHPQFAVGVPVIIAIQCAFVSYLALWNILMI